MNTYNPKEFGFNHLIKYFKKHPYPNFEYNIYVDKYKVKFLVEPYIKTSQTYAYMTTKEEIEQGNYDSLPNSFVIKSTKGSGLSYHRMVTSPFDMNVFIPTMKQWLLPHPHMATQKQYDLVTPGVLIEEHLGNNLIDYKFHMFHGKLEMIQLHINNISRII